MTLDQIECGKNYECLIGGKPRLVFVQDIIPSGVIALTCESHQERSREVWIKTDDIGKRIISRVDDVSAWRLKNGD